MKPRWVLLAVVGGMCALLRAEVQLEQLENQYTLGDHWSFSWYQPPSGPREPIITIKHGIDAVPFHFHCWDDATGYPGVPADIYSIGGDSESYVLVYLKVVAADGVSPGAANVGWLDFDGNMQCWIQAFHITGTLGTLDLPSYIRGTYGDPFTVADIAEPLFVSYGIWSAFSITGGGPHLGDLLVGEFYGSTTTITGEMVGDITIDSSFYNSTLTINGDLTGDVTAFLGTDSTLTVNGNAYGSVLGYFFDSTSVTINGDAYGSVSGDYVYNTSVTINGDAYGSVLGIDFTDTSVMIDGDLESGAILDIGHFYGDEEDPPGITVTGSAPGTIHLGSG